MGIKESGKNLQFETEQGYAEDFMEGNNCGECGRCRWALLSFIHNLHDLFIIYLVRS